ncbi:MAG: hypothetical protein Q9183_007591, partial [Haloplaca sp. 2 TL-2023]
MLLQHISNVPMNRDQIFLVATAVVGILTAVTYVFRRVIIRKLSSRWHASSKTAPLRFSNPAICRRILQSETHPLDDTLKNQLSFAVSRAVPNQRLVRAFGIQSGFTTYHEQERNDFRRKAEGMLKIDNVRWKHIATTATHLAEGIVEKMRGPDKGFGRLEEM